MCFSQNKNSAYLPVYCQNRIACQEYFDWKDVGFIRNQKKKSTARLNSRDEPANSKPTKNLFFYFNKII